MSKILKTIASNAKNAAQGTKNLFLRASAGSRLKPRWVAFQITDRCNSRCHHCNIWQMEPDKNPLTAEEIECAFGDPLFSEAKYIQISGGEPTLRTDIEDVILKTHRVLPNAIIQLSTNGLLPERTIKVVKNVISKGVHLNVGVSLDGIGDEHDKIRGIPGNFEKADRLIYELAELRNNCIGNLHISAGIVVSDLTLKSLVPVREYSRKLNIDLTEAWYNECEFYGNVGGHTISADMNNAIKTQPPSPLKDLWLRHLKRKSIKFPCFAMHTFCVLKCNGDVVPCLNFFDVPVGNVKEQTPTEIWRSTRMEEVRNKVKTCSGCLNSWGVGWSLGSSYYQTPLFYLKHPLFVLKKLKES
ncbi:MAG: radical SAM protein [Candidatus Brocadia sinica]|nr:radical SAM protein [Candidatus Brocadia sinica]